MFYSISHSLRPLTFMLILRIKSSIRRRILMALLLEVIGGKVWYYTLKFGYLYFQYINA
jgi:hypothetical protein